MKNGTQIAIIILGFVLAVPFFSYALSVNGELPEFSTSTVRLFSADLVTSYDLPKKYYTEELPVGYDLKRFYDTDLNNVCYLYRETSISCVKL